MRHRKEIDFRNFAQLPLELDADPLSALLSQPPSSSGLQAQYRLKEVEYWERQKTAALIALEAARIPIAATAAEGSRSSMEKMVCVDPNSSEHAETVAVFRQRLRAHHDELEARYNDFVKADKKLTKARAELLTVYDTRLLEVAAGEDAEILEKEALSRPVGPIGDESIETLDESSVAMKKLNDEAMKLSMAELAARLVRNPTAGWSLTDRGRRILYLMTYVQSRVRMCIVMRRMRCLRRSRRLLDRICIEYQFYFWRKHVQAVTKYRRRLMLSALVPLQGYANLARLRRGVFALHFTRAKTAGLIYRIFELWRRLAVLHNQNPGRQDRLHQLRYLPEWDDCLALETREHNLMRLAAITGGPASKVYELAHFWRRWRRYLKIERQDRRKMAIAVQHASHRCVQKHFYAWMDIISFTAQRDAAIIAKKQLYFGVWQRFVDRSKLDRSRSAALVPLKKLKVLNQWRKRVVDLRLKRTASNIVLLGNKPLLHFVIACWLGDATQVTFISAWRRWKLFIRRRTNFISFVGLRWQRRAEFLKRTAFSAWQSFRKEDEARPSTHTRRALFPPGLPADATEDLVSVDARCRMQCALLALAQSSRELDALGSPPIIEVTKLVPQASKSLPMKPVITKEVYNFNPGDLVVSEAPSLTSVDAILAERTASIALYKSWLDCHTSDPPTRLPRDKYLLATLFHLALAQHRKRQQAAGAAATLPSASPDDSMQEAVQELNPRLVRDYTIVALVGFPFHDMSANEVRIAELERFMTDDCATNYIINQRRITRDARINRKTTMRIAALRLFDKCSYFGCEPIESRSVGFSPFKYLMDQYTAIRDGEDTRKKSKKKKSVANAAAPGRGGKFFIPLPPVPRCRQLPFLLRLHLKAIVAPEQRQSHIACHRFSRVRLQRAILLMKLLGLVRIDPDAARQRLTLVSSMASAEEKGFKPDVVARKMQALADPHKELVVVRKIRSHTLDLVGFNPRFLKGAMQQRTKRLGKLRQLMRDGKALVHQCLAIGSTTHALAVPLRRTLSCLSMGELETMVETANKQQRRPRAASGATVPLPRVLEIVERALPTPPKAAAPLVPVFEPESEVPDVAEDLEEAEEVEETPSEEQVVTPQVEKVLSLEPSDSLPPFAKDDGHPPQQLIGDLSSDDEELLAEMGGANARRGKTLAERSTARSHRSVLDKVKKSDLRDLNALRAGQEQETTKRAAGDEEEIVFSDDVQGDASPGTKLLTDEYATKALLGDDEVASCEENSEVEPDGDGTSEKVAGAVPGVEGSRVAEDETGGIVGHTMNATQPTTGTENEDAKQTGAEGGLLPTFVARGQRAAGASRIPRLWGDDGKPFVPALERLLELSSRFGTLLNQQSRRELEALKVKVLQLAGDKPTVDAIAAQCDADRRLEEKISAFSAPKSPSPRSQQSPGRPPAHRVVHSSPSSKPRASSPEASRGTAPDTIVVPQPSSAPADYYQPPRVFKGVDEAQMLMLEPEKQRVDLAGQPVVDRRMQSTANLINDLVDTTSLAAAAKVPLHPLLQEVMRKHPRRVASADLSPRLGDSTAKVSFTSKLRTTVKQPPRVQLGDDFVRWVEHVSARLRHKSTHAEAIDDIVLEEGVLQRRLSQTDAIPDVKTREILALAVSTQLRIVRQLKETQPPVATTSELLDPAVEKVSFATGGNSAHRSMRLPSREPTPPLFTRASVEPLSDVEVSRLVTMIVSKDMRRQ